MDSKRVLLGEYGECDGVVHQCREGVEGEELNAVSAVCGGQEAGPNTPSRMSWVGGRPARETHPWLAAEEVL